MALGTSTSPDEKELQHRNFETPGDAEVAITQNTPNTTNYVSVATETRPQMQTKLLGSTASRLRTKVRYTFGHPMQQYPTGNDMLVDFDGPNDPYRPLNWPFRKKVITTILYGFTTSWITFASAVYSPAMGQIANEFDVKIETATAGISLVLFGFGMGPLIWGPLSELYGRKLAVLTVKRGLPRKSPLVFHMLTYPALFSCWCLFFRHWRSQRYSDNHDNKVFYRIFRQRSCH